MIPLIRAYLCPEDDTVFELRPNWEGVTARCPLCGGSAYPIARFLNRPLVITSGEAVALSEMEKLREDTLAALEGALEVARQQAKRDADA